MDNKEAVKRLLLLLGRYKKTIVVIVGCLLVSTGLNLCVPLISRRIMDDGFIGGNKKLLIELVLVSMVIYTINSLIDIVKEKKRVDISAKIQYFLSEQSFSHLMKLRVNYFNNTNYAETLNNINTDINQMTSIADSSVFFVITQAFSMTGGIIGLFIIDFRMTVLVLLFIPIKCVVMKYFAKKQKQIMDEFIKRNQEYAKWFGDTVGGVREVKLFNILDKKHEEFVLNQNNIIEKQKQMNMLGQWNTIIDSIMVQFLSTLLYILGANLVFDMKLSVGSVFAFITYSAYVTGPISAILNIGYLLSGIIPSTKVQKLKHDMKHKLHELYHLLENSDGHELSEKIGAMCIEFEQIDEKQYSDNPIVDSVLRIKFGRAKARGIKVETSIRIPKKMQLDHGDIGVLYGNLVDNAVEACSKVPEEQRFVKIENKYQSGILLLVITNSKTGKKNKSLKTTKKDNIRHGHGVQSVRKVVEKYNGTVSFTDKGDIFEVSAMLYGIEVKE